VIKLVRTDDELEHIKASWYVDDSGVLRWKRHAINRRIGDAVGLSKLRGKHRACFLFVNGKQSCFVESNVIWFLRTGEWPHANIDHVDGNPLNNMPDNLRLCNQSENNCNSILRSDNKTGAKGVYPAYRKWKVQVWKNKRCFSLGTFEDFELAELVSIEARKKLHGNFAFAGVR